MPVFWCTWHVWKLNKDLSLTVGHVHNHSEIIRETGRRVGLLASWSKCWQGRRAIKLERVTDIIKDVEMSLHCDLTDSGLVHLSCIIFHSVTCTCGSYKYLSCHHTITQIFGSESLKMFKSDYSKTQRWVIKSTWGAQILRGFWEELSLTFLTLLRVLFRLRLAFFIFSAFLRLGG